MKAVEGVAGATPFVLSEVMISTQLNTSGVLIKGVDPVTVGEVTDLKANMIQGELEYLSHPERIPIGASTWSHTYRPKFPTPNDAVERDGDGGRGAGDGPGAGGAAGEGREKSVEEQKADERRKQIEALEEMILGMPDVAASATGQGVAGQGVAASATQAVAGQGSAAPFIDPFADAAPDPGEPVRPGIILGKELSQSLRASVGDIVHVISPLGDGSVGPSGPIPKSRSFRVAGVFYSGFYEYDMKLVYVRLEELQDFMGFDGTATGVELRLANLDDTANIGASVNTALGGYPYRTKDWRQMNRNLFQALELEKVVMFVILIFIVLVASFNIVSTLYMFVTEKQKEIAILKSMGATNGAIRRIFVTIGLIIGVVGTVFGELIGLGLCLFVKLEGIKLDADVYYIDRLPIEINPYEFLVVAAAAIVTAFLATIPPASLAARTRPVDGLRYD